MTADRWRQMLGPMNAIVDAQRVTTTDSDPHPRAADLRRGTSTTVIEVDDLQKRYGDRLVVDGVSFTVEEGEIFGILGPNGAGKTTTVESIAGLRRPDGGRIRVLGLDPRVDRDRLRTLVGVQLQESELPERMTPGEALELFASFYDAPADPIRLLDDLDLADQRDTAYRNLSGGQKQRLSIALALVGRPRVAILDELSTGLDPNARRETWRVIESMRDQGVTVILVTHLMEEAERLADRVALFRDGRVIAVDTPAGIVARADPEQRIRFRPSIELDDGLLAGLPEVRRIERTGTTVVVTGQGDLLAAVTAVLARHGIVARDLRIEQASLDDAFLALTSRPAATTTGDLS
jgi:ABC-2 type transport system ATP-binding protein